jgi:hypothetical protein
MKIVSLPRAPEEKHSVEISHGHLVDDVTAGDLGLRRQVEHQAAADHWDRSTRPPARACVSYSSSHQDFTAFSQDSS